MRELGWSYKDEFHFGDVDIHVSEMCPRDQLLQFPDKGFIMHPLTWITMNSKTPEEELDLVLRYLVKRARNRVAALNKRTFYEGAEHED